MKNFLIGTVIGAAIAYAGHRVIMTQMKAVENLGKAVKDSE